MKKNILITALILIAILNINAQKIIRKPALMVVECNKDLYLNILHEQWKKELNIDNETLKNKVYTDVVKTINDSLTSEYLVRNINESTFSAIDINKIIKSDAGFFIDKIPDYENYKADKKNNYRSSHLQLKKHKKKNKAEKTIPSYNDKFLNVKFYNNNIFKIINKQGFRYILFITQVFIEKDLTGKYNNNTIVKVDYSMYNTKGEYLYGSKAVSKINTNTYNEYISTSIADIASQIKQKLNFNKIKQLNGN